MALLTLYLLRGQGSAPRGLVGAVATLDPQAHKAPPELSGHLVDEWRDPLVSIYPAMTGQRVSSRPAPWAPPETWGRTYLPVGDVVPVQLIVQIVAAAAVGTDGESRVCFIVQGQSLLGSWLNLGESEVCSSSFRCQDSPLQDPSDLAKVTVSDHSKPASPCSDSDKGPLLVVPGGRRGTVASKDPSA